MAKLNSKIAVIGGGITGLAAASYLNRSGQQVTLFESSHRLGGVLNTTHRKGFLIENSADMFVTEPNYAVRYCRELGFEDELIAPNTTNRFSCIARGNQLVRTPVGFSLMVPNKVESVLQSPLLTGTAKLRFLMERYCRPHFPPRDESLRSFAVRHYGQEFFERIVQPLVAGIYSAKAEELSIQATLRRFVEMEQKHGSLIEAGRCENQKCENQNMHDEQHSSGARYGMFVTPRNGMGSLIAAIQWSLGDVDIRFHANVESVKNSADQWVVTTHDAAEEFDGLIMATPANVAVRLLAGEDPAICQVLRTFSYGSMIVAAITCDHENFQGGPPHGFGFVVPEIENRSLIACSFSSNKFAGRAPGGKMLMRAFLGGRTVAKWLERSDQEIEKVVYSELQQWIGFQPDRKTEIQVLRWQNCMPQYLVGHLDKIAAIERHLQRQPSLALAGNSYHGVGIPACIESGIAAAKKIVEHLKSCERRQQSRVGQE